MTDQKLSGHSIIEANRTRNESSDQDDVLGGAGVKAKLQSLDREPIRINALKEGFPAIEIDLSWDRPEYKANNFLSLAKSAVTKEKADLDLGCLYELKDGQKGCLQAFGELYGSYDTAPYIQHSGDERTGESEGADESFTINGAHWNDIKRVLVYAYIYQGVENWNLIRSECMLRVGSHETVRLSLEAKKEVLPICALMTLENEDGHIVITRRAEYFRGHPALDRAYGYGIEWTKGEKA